MEGRERLSQKQGQTCDKSCHAHSLNIPRGGGASTLQGRSKLTLWWGDTEAQGSQVTPPGVGAEQRAGALTHRRLGLTVAQRQKELSHSARFHPTQVMPQEMHTREVSRLLFAHEKTQKVSVQVTRAFPCVVQTPVLGSAEFPPGWLVGLQNTVALCSIPGSRYPGTPEP